MGQLVRGKWTTETVDSSAGKYKRAASSFRAHIGQHFPAEANRYHLYISHACPWANRAAIFRVIKGLEDIITLMVVDPVVYDNGWEMKENIDTLNHKSYLHEIYALANPDYTGRVTVPVLWDKKEKTIVSNESADIIRMFNSAFDQLTGNKDDYYPKELRTEIEAINSIVYDSINNGVYKVGFATKQELYEEEVQKLFASLEKLEERLSKQRYLLGAALTEADWRLFTTLVRFDPVYVGHFKCNIKTLSAYHHLDNYLRDLYQSLGAAKTIHMDHIKKHYYLSMRNINPGGIVPLGPRVDFSAPHDRAAL